jgi:sugar O-acyltransferase (sialic acid O-acetyltransferase NeuD family)
MDVLIIGAGGHGQVVADILVTALQCGSHLRPSGYVDDDQGLWRKTLLDLPVFGSIDEWATFGRDAVILGIGDNLTRCRMFERLSRQRVSFATALHPSAILSPSCELGRGSVVCAGAIVSTLASVGVNAILNTGCSVDHHNDIGDHVHIAPGARLGGNVTIGQGTLIGIGATVMPGRRVGAWSIVGAGAVVTEDLPPGVVAAGVPARILSHNTTSLSATG